MRESLNTERTGNYEARVKAELATVSAEADRQRGQRNLSNEARVPLREAAGLNENEPICSVVSIARSNAVKGYVEPVYVWRRQYHASPNPARMHECPGVAGQAWGEGCSR
ncbi:MAG: hypothetical protein M1476_00565 [Candidatus Thermoplasmatota archaeon]|nr:hypothetical protein [Candidatus Thermoplasmatota archaeon]